MNDLKYSVLMSLYAKENPSFLVESIESMLNQTLIPNEIVIIKDGPLSYELEEVIKQYEKNEIIKFYTLSKNVGLGKTLSFGLEKCENEYIARMDTDDISSPERCEIQLNYLKKNKNVSVVGSNIAEFEISKTKCF
jgi:glycosyltransferase involved in cell wall biosynthesis